MEEVDGSLKLEMESIEILEKDTNQSITLIVPFGDLDDFIKLRDRKTKEKYDLLEGAIVTEKLSKLLELEKGDTITLRGEEDYSVVVSDITENYLYHYVYISKNVYQGENYNTIFLKTQWI